MRDVAAELARWRGEGKKVAVATVVATRLSAPRPVGSKFVVSETGELAGSVSGGCVENDVYECAREVLESGVPRLLTYGISDDEALEVGLPCGGEIDVFVERFEEMIVADGERAVAFTVLEGEHAGAKLLVMLDSGETLGDGPPELAARAAEIQRNGVLQVKGEKIYAEVYGPPPRFVVFGAVDTAESLCAAAKLVGWDTVVVDARAAFATPERLPSADRILVSWPEDALPELGLDRDTAVACLNHDARFDIPALQGALASDAFYVGAIGSRKTQAGRREKLLEAGVQEEALSRIHGPAGLDLGADTPAETALAILAEALAARAGRSGRALRDSPTRIHVEG
jgi:xanthine dehydrogenase accessory factor